MAGTPIADTDKPTKVIQLGCDPVVTVTLVDDGTGTLRGTILSDDPENTDIDALFFNFSDDAETAGIALPKTNWAFQGLDNLTTQVDTQQDGIGSLSNGATLNDCYDVRIEFGTGESGSDGTVTATSTTFYLGGGDFNLTLDDIDHDSLLVAVNSETGNGLALTSGSSGGEQTTLVTLSEDFDHIHDPDDSDLIESDGRWDVRHDQLFTNGHRDGELRFEEVETDGPVTLSFDARAHNLDRFEADGWAKDSLRVEVQIDGGDWILLDEFVVNDHGTALVGSETGQTITDDLSTLTYEGGALADAEDSAQFRIVSDISAHDERVMIDDVEITATETTDSDAPNTEDVVLQEIDFDHVRDADDEADVARDGGWEVHGNKAFTNGHNDGTLELEEVEADGPVKLSLTAEACGLRNFENSGRHADNLDIQVQIDGGEWITLDRFMVNDDGTALVGSETGQTITDEPGTLDYSGGVLDSAEHDVQFRIVSDISANNEVVKIDDITVSAIESVDEDAGAKTHEAFEDAEAGDTVMDQFDGFSVVGQRAGDDPDSENDAMIFDTANPTGRDWDLGFEDQGNAIIISEDNDARDPDDEAHGGTLDFTFEQVSTVESLTVLDVEEDGGSIDLFDADGALLNSIDIPGAGNNSAQEIDIDTAGVSSMLVTFVGSGAVDDLCFSSDAPDSGTDCTDLQYALDDEGDDTCACEDDMLVA